MDKLCCILGGLVLGVAVGVLIMMPKARVDRALVDRCRRQVAIVAAMPAEERARFWETTMKNDALRQQWAIVTAVADIQVAE